MNFGTCQGCMRAVGDPLALTGDGYCAECDTRPVSEFEEIAADDLMDLLTSPDGDAE